MIRKLYKALEQKERALRRSFGRNIADPKERRRSQWHVTFLDHGIFRKFWHNFSQVAPGVFRCNQPDHKRLAVYRAKGIKTVVNLRGVARQPHYLFEEESCAALGITLIPLQLSARNAPKRARLLALLDLFETLDRPFLIHCKSGADRTGLAGVLYLMEQEGLPLDLAKRQLSLRYLHLRRTSTGILDHFLDVYQARDARSPIGIRDWIANEYNRDALTASFEEKQGALKPWQGWL